MILDSEQYIILLICNSNICLNTINKICWSVACRRYCKCHRNYPWEPFLCQGRETYQSPLVHGYNSLGEEEYEPKFVSILNGITKEKCETSSPKVSFERRKMVSLLYCTIPCFHLNKELNMKPLLFIEIYLDIKN